jgi:hypothetical protein
MTHNISLVICDNSHMKYMSQKQCKIVIEVSRTVSKL